jgi:hypothetical protein
MKNDFELNIASISPISSAFKFLHECNSYLLESFPIISPMPDLLRMYYISLCYGFVLDSDDEISICTKLYLR